MICKDLHIYNISVELETKLFRLICDVPFDWKIEQIKQIKRSSSSISANIAEGYGKRYYPKDFIRFLYVALGSSDETQHHLKILYNKECIGDEDFTGLSKRYKNLSVRILNFIKYLKKKHNIG